MRSASQPGGCGTGALTLTLPLTLTLTLTLTLILTLTLSPTLTPTLTLTRRLWHRVTKCNSGLRQSIVFWARYTYHAHTYHDHIYCGHAYHWRHLLWLYLGGRCVTTASRLRETTETRRLRSRSVVCSARGVRVACAVIRHHYTPCGRHCIPPRKLPIHKAQCPPRHQRTKAPRNGGTARAAGHTDTMATGRRG